MSAGTEHSPDDFQFTGESFDQNKGSTDGTVLDQPRNKSKEKKEKLVIYQTLRRKKAKKSAWTPLTCISNITERKR